MLGMVTNRKRATGAWAKLKQNREKAAANGETSSHDEPLKKFQ
jgi:hypothetical protein